MNEKERAKRPRLERTEPIRAFGGLFGFPAASGEGARTGAASLGDVVSRSVELGYRVVDEYVRQGQAAAQRMGERPFRPERAVQDVQQLTARMVQHASDFMRLWFEVVQLATTGGERRQTAESEGTAGPPAAVDEGRAPRIRVELASTRQAEVSLELRPDAGAGPLVVQSLRASEPDKPRLSDVAVHATPGDDTLLLRVGVPADHPAGVYNGLIVDERTSRPVGTVSVRLAPPV
jgi:hypothetical protein